MANDKSRWAKALFEIINEDQEPFYIRIGGRDSWALECLMSLGRKGCTPIDTPGPRWSGYVHVLRELNVQIETITEKHGGPFKGTHARYVLHSKVQRVESEAA